MWTLGKGKKEEGKTILHISQGIGYFSISKTNPNIGEGRMKFLKLRGKRTFIGGGSRRDFGVGRLKNG